MSDGRIIIDTAIDQSGADRGLSELQSKMQASADKMKNVGTTMSKNITLPLVAVGGAALKVASDFDDVTRKIQAQLGVTSEEADKLATSAKNVWTSGFGESLEETSGAITKVRQNIGDLNGEELEDVTQKAFMLSEAFDADINESTRAAGQLMKDFKSSSSEAFDLITWGFQNGLDYTGEWLDTVREYSPQFSEMGFTAEQMGNMMKAGFDAGAWSLDKIGDSIKESHLRMGDLSKSTLAAYSSLGYTEEEAYKFIDAINKGGEEGNKAFQQLVGDLMSIEDATERNSASVGLFGTQYEDLREKVIFAMADAENSIEGLAGTSDKATEALQQSFSKRLSSIWRESQAALLPLGQILLDLAEKVLPYVERAISSLSNWFNGLSDNTKIMVVAIGGILAAAGPVLVVLGSIVGAISNLLPIIATAWKWFSKISAIFKYVRIVLLALTSPIGLIAIAVVGLAILIYKYWDEIKEFTISAWNATIEFLKAAWEWLKETASSVWQSIIDTIVAKLEAVSLFISTIMDAIKIIIDNAWNWISEKFMSVLQSIAETLGINFDSIRNNVQTVMDTIKQTIDTVWYFIKTSFTNALNFIKALVTGDFQKAKEIIKSQMDLIKETIGYIWSDIKEVFWNIIDAIKTLVRNKFNDIKNGIKEKMDAAKETISNIWDEVMSFFEGIDLWQTGKDIIQGLIDGVGSMASSLVEKVTSVVGGVKDTITELFNIHSPSRWMRDMIGKNMILGWEIGIDKEKSNVMNKADEMATWMSPTMPNLSSLLPDVTSSAPATTNNNTSVTNNSPVQVELNYSGSASLEEVRKMASVLSEEIDKMTKRKARQGGVIFAN